MSFYIKNKFILPLIISIEKTRKETLTVSKSALHFHMSEKIEGIFLIFKKNLLTLYFKQNKAYIRSIVK